MPRTDLLPMLNYRQSGLVRFFARRRGLSTQTPGNIDETGSAGEVLGRAGDGNTDVPRGTPYFVRGWAIDLGRIRVPWDILMEVDGHVMPARVELGLPRPDVARSFGSRALHASGFSALVSTGSLAAGPHALGVRAVVGRYGAAFARLPVTTHFNISGQLATVHAPPPMLQQVAGRFALDALAPVSERDVVALTGWGLDEESRPFAAVAARIGGQTWNEGWTGIHRPDAPEAGGAAAGFCVRIRFNTVDPGLHALQFAAKTCDGRWYALGDARELTVVSAPGSISRWAKPLVDSGKAAILDANGRLQTELQVSRIGAPLIIAGRLERTSPLGAPVRLIARGSDASERTLTAWSTPTSDPGLALFGAEIPPRALPPGDYELFIEAPDRSHRFIGRAVTGCRVRVARRPEAPA